jgi:hypothetical protein
MIDPSDLIRRASELAKHADHEDDPTIRQRLRRMATYYVEIAESERRMAGHPPSIASIGEIFFKR